MLLSLASIMMPMTLSAQESYTWGFETEEEFNQWITVDKDGDEFDWEYFSNESRETGRHTTHGGDGIAISASYDTETAISSFIYISTQLLTSGRGFFQIPCI